MKTNLKAVTPVGEFTRATDSLYTHVVVWNSPRAAKAVVEGRSGGVAGRWVKDRGYGVTWHSSERAAQAATRVYKWDAQKATLVGVFAVKTVSSTHDLREGVLTLFTDGTHALEKEAPQDDRAKQDALWKKLTGQPFHKVGGK